VPPDDISSSYTYERCVVFRVASDGSRICFLSNPTVMDVLKITPPFFYSYQCGSTLLASYIPVHLYSVSLQVLFTIVTLIVIFSSSSKAYHPRWLLSMFPGVCWPAHWQSAGGSAIDLKALPVMIKSHQIISRTMNNVILLLSFGLCSPVLCSSIVVSICAHLCSWLMLIGRFVSLRIETRTTLDSFPPSTETDGGSFVSLSSPLPGPFLLCPSSLPHSLQRHRMTIRRPSTTRSFVS